MYVLLLLTVELVNVQINIVVDPYSDDATENCFCYIWDVTILEYLIRILTNSLLLIVIV